MIESQNNEENERIQTVIKEKWGDEEAELRQNIFATFVLAEETD